MYSSHIKEEKYYNFKELETQGSANSIGKRKNFMEITTIFLQKAYKMLSKETTVGANVREGFRKF